MMETEKRYMAKFAAAYYRGRSGRTGLPALSDQERETPLDLLSHDLAEQIIIKGTEIEDKLYYFKRTHEEMPRVKKVLGFLRSVDFSSLLDIGSGRGVFLLPFLEQFPWVQVTSMDLLAHRVQFMRDLHEGGVKRLCAMEADICASDLPDHAVDVVTMLEVLEHIPQVEKAIAQAVRIAAKHVVVTVPSKPDDNPEHIHLLTKGDLTDMFNRAGCARLRFDGVNGHLFMVATIGSKGENA